MYHLKKNGDIRLFLLFVKREVEITAIIANTSLICQLLHFSPRCSPGTVNITDECNYVLTMNEDSGKRRQLIK